MSAQRRALLFTHLEPVAGWMKNQVFFDAVHIPAAALLGERNQGWSQMRETLAVERSGLALCAAVRRTLEEVIARCGTLVRDGRRLIEHEHVQHRLADLLIEIDAWRLLCWRVVQLQAAGQPIDVAAAIVAIQRKDVLPRFQAALSAITGSYAVLRSGAEDALLHGELEFWQRESLHTHGGGTPEIQRNIVARHGLGLPR